MFLKIIKNDCYRKKIITFTVFLFITIAVILGATATNIIANLIQSMSELKKYSVPADLAQMHSGEYNQEALDQFTEAQQDNIAMQETVLLLNFEGMNIRYGNNESLAGTIQDISFVVQNKKFDFLLDQNNKKLEVQKGYVAVPIYFMQECHLKPGDSITVVGEGYQKKFVISDYARDYEMSNSLSSSKRFVINQADYKEMLDKQVGEPEYLIEFKMTKDGDIRAVQTAYIEAGLPSNGPNIDGKAFMILNALSDAVVSMTIIMISFLMISIATICIRLIFLATIDEDLREIGVMKAMGISKKDIKKVYLSKYRAMSVAAGILGYLLSFIVVNLFSGNMRLYMSSDLSGSLKYLLSIIAPLFVYFMIITFCKRTLKKIDKISAVEAIRSDIIRKERKRTYSFPLLKNRFLNINIYMGIRDVWKRLKLYRLLIVIFIVCTFIIILPLRLYNTMNSPEFVTYMGIGKCDMRIDLRRTDTITEDFTKLQDALKNDSDIEKYAAYITCAYPVKNPEGSWDYINIETGDFSVFPLNYLEGRAPKGSGEIALSYANASKSGLDKKVGDEVLLKLGGEEKTLKVSGIYQDVTNGGKTAKADTSLELNQKAVLWYIVYMDLASGVNINEKMDYYQKNFRSVQANNEQEYARQTLGNMNEQLRIVVVAGFAIAAIIVALITALFLRMLLSKDMTQNAIMRSMGLTSKNIKHQYLAGTLLVLILGIVLGLLASGLLGEPIVSLGMSLLGASKIQFIDVIWQTWILCPLVLIIIVGFTISVCCNVTAKDDISVALRR